MRRVLLVPAAGLGRRLGSSRPKLLTPVAGRSMIDRVLDLHASFCQHAVVVVHPSFLELVATHFAETGRRVALVIQPAPVGMLDAIVRARNAVSAHGPDRVWITWCDQVAISRGTLDHLAERERVESHLAAVLPTSRHPHPYIHFDRDAKGRLTGVRQRREGDAMPEHGESDAGLFSLAASVYTQELADYAENLIGGRTTGELNFLPFLPWLASRARVETFPVDPIESVGINTLEELARIEQALRARETR